MPTEITLSGFNCRIDTDQEPEQLVCVWRGNVVADGEPISFYAQNPPEDSPQDGLDNALVENDYSLP